MGTGLEIGLLAAGVVTSLVGAGVSYYATQESAKTQSAIAGYNYQLQQDALSAQREADIQALQLSTAQYGLQQSLNDIEKSQLGTQTAALDLQDNLNKQALDLQHQQIDQQRQIYEANRQLAETAAAQIALEDVENRRRSQKEEEATISHQRAVYASAGVLMEGTPLAVLGETAALFSLQQADQTYQARLEYEGKLLEARSIGLDIEALSLDDQLINLQGALDSSQINLDKSALNLQAAGIDIQQSQLDINKTLLDLDQYSVQSQFLTDTRQNEINLLAGQAGASATSSLAYTNLFSSIGSSLSSASKLFPTNIA